MQTTQYVPSATHSHTLRLASVKMYDASAAHLPTRLHFEMRCSSHFLSIFTSVSTYCDRPSCVSCHTIRVECRSFFSSDISVIWQNETFFSPCMDGIVFTSDVSLCVLYNYSVTWLSARLLSPCRSVSSCTSQSSRVLQILYLLWTW